ncbi:MAG TPA: DUF2842 domain-containing protein [Caulobacteraceae bacterium]|nr:DUF2842 domain-containing protein [Caulobacteraceae bacterium]
MKGGARRALASLGALVFLVAWVWAATVVADRLPDVMWLKLLYFAVVGTAWGLPLFPLIAWANRKD